MDNSKLSATVLQAVALGVGAKDVGVVINNKCYQTSLNAILSNNPLPIPKQPKLDKIE